MKQSYLTSETYGIGELISQKKRFRVPRHQRDYSWSLEEVETFISDIQEAIKRKANDYFIGLIVLHGPYGGVWEILDGQQRLATTTMLFSAIRQWLTESGYNADATQIDQEFIALRRLGQEPIARIELNSNDQAAFEELVLHTAPNQRIKQFVVQAPHHSSNRRLGEAAMACRTAISKWAFSPEGDVNEQVARLYTLATYLEASVKTVCLEVGSETDAYVIFESLNYRGHDLSVLDLVKNQIYGHASPEDENIIAQNWHKMLETIQERDADDFLKVFWTSQYGRVQRGGFFDQVKQRYKDSDQVFRLSNDLALSADPYVALEDPSHEIWSDYSNDCRHYIGVLKRLLSKQVRPVILSALRVQMPEREFEALLRFLLVLTVRYQTVGRRRTGALEINCSRIAATISQRQIVSAKEVASSMSSIMPSDEEFESDFQRYSEGVNKRAHYMLAALEVGARFGSYDIKNVDDLLEQASGPTVSNVLPKQPGQEWDMVLERDPDFYAEALDRLGNRILIETDLARQLGRTASPSWMCELALKSDFILTRQLGERWSTWDRSALQRRQEELARIALRVWAIPEIGR